MNIDKILKVYVVPETGEQLIEEFTAQIIGLNIMNEIIIDSKKYYHVNSKIIDELKQLDYQIFLISLPLNLSCNKVITPTKLKTITIFQLSDNFYINLSDSFELSSIEAEKIDLENNKYGPLNEKDLKKLKLNFNIEIIDMDKKEQTKKR